MTREPSVNINVSRIVNKILKSKRREFRKLGIFPIRPLIKFALPGEGVHNGAWLPMGSSTDLLGRPAGSKRIHVVDSSIIPSVPAGAITFTVMANAARIAKNSC
jgi:hypothetical protein